MYAVVFVTVPNMKAARGIAKSLVQSKLAACVNIIPVIESLYRWKGKLCEDKELLLIIKTKKAVFGKLADKIRSIHPYEVPEIISLPITAGDKPYLRWLKQSIIM
ncbi:MAG: divalent-cation tolerance protein CutA [Planctomycetota bacterium]